MKITNLSIHVVETGPARIHRLIQVPGVGRTQYTHTSGAHPTTGYAYILRVMTDEGIEGICDVNPQCISAGPRAMLEILRENVLGADPLDREFLFQKLFLGTRWVYQKQGWFGAFDVCLWDIAGKAAGLPVTALMGKVRDGMPVYLTAGDGTVEHYIEHTERGKELGINAYKPHSYKGGKADLPIIAALRDHVGPGYDLMLDPVCSYTLREAVEVGRLMEELDYVWLEEPFHEQKMEQYRELCGELTIPVMSNETLMHDMVLSAQWLMNGATDKLRANASYGGATQVLKLAHFAELYGTTVEMNGMGGLFGIVHATLGACIENTGWYELSCGDWKVRPDDRVKAPAAGVGLLNPPRVAGGKMMAVPGPGWGAQWDLDYLGRKSVETL